LEAFTKFGSDLDAATTATLAKGARNVEILKQPQFSPLRVDQQVAIIYLGTKGLVKDVPVNQITAFEKDFLETMENSHKDALNVFASGKLDESATSTVEQVAADLVKRYAVG